MSHTGRKASEHNPSGHLCISTYFKTLCNLGSNLPAVWSDIILLSHLESVGKIFLYSLHHFQQPFDYLLTLMPDVFSFYLLSKPDLSSLAQKSEFSTFLCNWHSLHFQVYWLKLFFFKACMQETEVYLFFFFLNKTNSKHYKIFSPPFCKNEAQAII